jgi:hypothetical protein
MAEPTDLSEDDIRKAVLNLTDAVRLIAQSVDVFVLKLRRVWPLRDYPEISTSHNELHMSLLAANQRLHAAVDILVKNDDERSA